MSSRLFLAASSHTSIAMIGRCWASVCRLGDCHARSEVSAVFGIDFDENQRAALRRYQYSSKEAHSSPPQKMCARANAMALRHRAF